MAGKVTRLGPMPNHRFAGSGLSIIVAITPSAPSSRAGTGPTAECA
jgi:hypothetical protein